MYQFVKDNCTDFPVLRLCTTLGLSRSSYYAWENGESYQPRSSAQQIEELRVEKAFEKHRRRYGVRRLRVELSRDGHNLSFWRIRQIMRLKGLKAIQPRSFIPRTTESRHPYPMSPNLLLDRPFPEGLNEVWVGDITYIPLSDSRWAYLSAWMDLCSRRIIGWTLADHMREELVASSFKQAFNKRKPIKELIAHSDRGGQYAGSMFRGMLDKWQIRQSMSRADNPYDNAFMESCFSRFKAELLQGGVFDSLEDAYTEIFEYIEMYYNPIRLHSSLGYIPPCEYEMANLDLSTKTQPMGKRKK